MLRAAGVLANPYRPEQVNDRAGYGGGKGWMPNWNLKAKAAVILALFALVALLFTRGIPTVQPGAQSKPSSPPT